MGTIPSHRPWRPTPLPAKLPPMASRHRLPGFEDLPLLLNADELASLLRVTRKSIYVMVERGEIPGVTKLGRRLRFRRDAIEAWLAAASE